jgi:hypothetical protein
MNRQKPPKNNLRNVALLSGIAFEMGAIIYLSVQGGKWLDGHYDMENKTFTIIATLLGVAISIWVVLRHLKRVKY